MMRVLANICPLSRLPHYIIYFNFTMSLFDDLDDRDNQNALDILAGHSYHEVE